MISLTQSVDEAAELTALLQHDLVTDNRDPVLEQLVRSTAEEFGADFALINLIDAARQTSIYRNDPAFLQAPRQHAFCTRVVESDAELVVLDTTEHPDFHENPLVTGMPGLRFYAGVPLRAPSGRPIGALCIADTAPRESFGESERARLRESAALVRSKFESRYLEARRHISQERFETIVAASPDSIVCIDENARIVFWNPAAEALLDRGADDLLGLHLGAVMPELFNGGGEVARPGGYPAALRERIGLTTALRLHGKDGSGIDIELSLSAWSEVGRERLGLILRDVSERRAHQESLFRSANFDALTELPNRTLLRNRIEKSGREGQAGAVLMLDLDHFKDVNDTLGHPTGDALLRLVAERLQACVRSHDMVARLGGDEFVVWLDHVAEAADVPPLATRIIECLSEPYTIDEQTIIVGVSVGIAQSPHHGQGADELLAHADMALYRAKAEGRHCHQMFTPDLKREVQHRRRLGEELRRAVEAGQFELFYQPQVRLSDGALTGAEALIRWRHPQRGLVSPAQFLPALESGRYAGVVGDWVLRTACAQAAAWRSGADSTFRMGINLFLAQFKRGDLVAKVRTTLAEMRLPAEALELEITENIVFDDAGVRASLRTLRDEGVGISFDDYGTGYASLSLLKRFPLTRLKIDRSFVSGMMTSHEDATIVRSILQLGHGFKLDVIAEGIETQAEHAKLKAKGCREGQGYLFGKPMPAEEFTERFFGRPYQAETTLNAA